jgi:lipopolysaccharide export system permease protein
MRLIDKLVFIDLVGPFINGLFMFIMLLFAATYLFPATDLIVRGIPIVEVLKFTLYNLPSLLTQTFPMAMLLASLLGFGRISADSEMAAIFASGISFPRSARAVVIMGLVVSVVAFVWNDTIVPPASARALAIRKDAEKHLQASDRPINYDVMGANGLEEKVNIQGGFDSVTRSLRRVSIVRYSTTPKTAGQVAVVLCCKWASAKDQRGLDWTYHDGYVTTYLPADDGRGVESVGTTNFKVLKSTPRGATVGKKFDDVLAVQRDDPNSRSFATMRRQIQEDRQKGIDTGGEEVDLYGKIALPIASLVFGIVGAALGKNTQRGGGKSVGFGMAIFIVFLYWIFYHSMYVVGKGGGLPPLLASFLPDIVGTVVGVVLTVRASR